jgi:hypothetical protein
MAADDREDGILLLQRRRGRSILCPGAGNPRNHLFFDGLSGAIVAAVPIWGGLKMSRLSVLLLLALVAGVAGADTLDMRETNPATSRFDEGGKPSRGMTQARVEARYGTPESRVSPVGEPPISRWEYSNFVVFFEYDKVIHSVTKR